MKNSARIFITLSIFLVICAAIMGCSSSSGSTAATDTVATTATTNEPLYTAGDIVSSSSSASTAWLVISYDSSTESYTRAFIYKNTDGTWGYRINSNTETATQKVMESVYKVKITHVTVSSIPTAAPTTVVTTKVTTAKATTVATAATTTTAVKPSIKDMDPDEGYAGNSVDTIITGINFVSGATAKLQHSGESSITASDVTWDSATQLDCTFDIPDGTTVGPWDIVITNPDGQSGKYTNYFMVRNETVDE